MSVLDDEIDRKWSLPDVPFIGAEESQQRRVEYEASRRQHRIDNPIIEKPGPFVIPPELERERTERIARQQWREPESKEEFAVSVTDIPLRVGLFSQ